MEQKFIYRNHLKKIQKWMLIIGIPTSVLFIILGIILGIVMGQYIFVGIGIFFCLYDFLLYKTYDRFTKAEFILDEEKIILKIKDVIKQEIKYADITKIDSKSISYTGGWMMIYGQSKKPLRLMVTIKDVGLMIKLIKQKVDEIEQSHVYQEDKLNKFFKTAYYADQSWQRASYFMPRFILIILTQMVLAISLLIIKENELIGYIFIVAILTLLFGFIYVEYFIYVKNIRKQSDQTSWDIVTYDEKLAKKRLKKVLQLGMMATMIALIIGLFL
ncbi:MAG: hypothetical protein RBQ71_06250 [Acholeplasmataceae bacterium]|jgi:hypothetical protein|nr:hypothetical protein [Acholeplasmataceae bacterium]